MMMILTLFKFVILLLYFCVHPLYSFQKFGHTKTQRESIYRRQKNINKEKKCTSKSILRASPLSDHATADKIQFLLTQAVKLMRLDGTSTVEDEGGKKKNGNTKEGVDPDGSATIVQPLLPLELKFASSHRHTIVLQDAQAAHAYLSLPASEYSLLDTKMVSRDSLRDDTFILTLPLGDITATTASFQTCKY